MPTVRLRKRLLDRLVKSANSAGELGLALLMTAGVVHCGGSTQTGPGEGTSDAAADHGLAIEAAQEGGAVIEAAGGDGSPNPMVEAATYLDAGSDAHPSPMVEAPAPPPDSGADAHGPVVEAVTFPDAGSDASHSPWVEAPALN